jgi:hypothetical protein
MSRSPHTAAVRASACAQLSNMRMCKYGTATTGPSPQNMGKCQGQCPGPGQGQGQGQGPGQGQGQPEGQGQAGRVRAGSGRHIRRSHTDRDPRSRQWDFRSYVGKRCTRRDRPATTDDDHGGSSAAHTRSDTARKRPDTRAESPHQIPHPPDFPTESTIDSGISAAIWPRGALGPSRDYRRCPGPNTQSVWTHTDAPTHDSYRATTTHAFMRAQVLRGPKDVSYYFERVAITGRPIG